MRPEGSAAELEARRRWAVELLAKGKTCPEVAELVGRSLSSVKRWKAAWKKGDGMN
jgi:transposase